MNKLARLFFLALFINVRGLFREYEVQKFSRRRNIEFFKRLKTKSCGVNWRFRVQ